MGSDPRGGLGNSETRNLEYAQEYPGICTLGILESGICRGVSWNLPMRKHGIWILGSLSADPRRGPGNSETRNLEFAEEYPGVCTLGNMESGFWGPSADPRRGPGNSETRNLEFAIWKNWGFRAARLPPPPPPPRALGDRSSLPGPSPPWSTVGQPLFVNGHIMIVHVYLDTHTVICGITRNLEKFSFAFKMPSAPKSARPRTITYATIPRSCPRSRSHRTSTRKERKDTLDTVA